MVLGILFFVACNEVGCPNQQVRLVQLRLADKPEREDCLHLSIVRNQVFRTHDALGSTTIHKEQVSVRMAMTYGRINKGTP
jgi:hypothetical protein